MPFKLVSLASLILPLAAFAAPTAQDTPSALAGNGSLVCGPDQLYVVEKDGRTMNWPSATAFGNNVGCVDRPAGFRRVQYDTTVESTDGSVTASVFDLESRLPPFPPQFSTLWDNIIGAACGSTFCDGQTQTKLMISSNPYLDGGQLIMKVNGRFANADLRDKFFRLARQAFDRSVDRRNGADQIHEDGLEKMYATSERDGALGGFLDVEFSKGGTRSCPDVVNGINALGSLVPQLAPLFGTAGAICAFIG